MAIFTAWAKINFIPLEAIAFDCMVQFHHDSLSTFIVDQCCSSSHNSVLLHPATNTDDPQLPNIHCKTLQVCMLTYCFYFVAAALASS